MVIRNFIICILLLSSASAYGQLVRVRVTNYGGTDSVQAVKRFIDQTLQILENKVNDELPSEPPERIMKGMADSSVMAAKGIGSDYASYMDTFLIGAGAGVAADFAHDNNTDSDVSGVGAATGLITGVKASKVGIPDFWGLEANRLNLYLNFMKIGHEQNLKDNGGIKTDARVRLLNLGLHFRYDWIDPKGNSLLGWGGVKLHWGYEYNNSEIQFKSEINRLIQEVDDDGTSLNGRIVGSPNYDIEIQTHSIPLEVSTDFRLFYIATLYGGLGTDINYGKAKGSGPVTVETSPVVCTGGGFCGAGGRSLTVAVDANVDAEGKVHPLYLRGFAGLQVNIPYFRIFAQVDKAFGTELVALSAGLRFAY